MFHFESGNLIGHDEIIAMSLEHHSGNGYVTPHVRDGNLPQREVGYEPQGKWQISGIE